MQTRRTARSHIRRPASTRSECEKLAGYENFGQTSGAEPVSDEQNTTGMVNDVSKPAGLFQGFAAGHMLLPKRKAMAVCDNTREGANAPESDRGGQSVLCFAGKKLTRGQIEG